jgi:hypothetical protein
MKQIPINQNTVWESWQFESLPGAAGDAVEKATRSAMAFAKALPPIPNMSESEKLEAVKMAIELGYMRLTENGNIEVICPAADGA